MKYLLDTNTVIYFFKGMGCVSENLLARAPSEIGVSSVTLYELGIGLAKSRRQRQRQQQLGEFVDAITVIPFDVGEAQAAAALRAELEQRGQPIGPLDTLLAGTALAHRLTFVTHNTREFARVKSLRVVDWF